jgi:transcriptional regulator with XRE-family HTH domain
MSSIYQQDGSDDGRYAARLGSRIRELRIGVGLTQTDLGSPLTRSFVSAVEHGRTLPSLRALLLISARLGVSAGQLLDDLEWTIPAIYTGVHAGNDPSPREGR